MTRISKSIAAIFCVAFPSTLLADWDSQTWTSVQFSTKASDKWRIVGELVNRYSNGSQQFVTRSTRAGATYLVTESMSYSLIGETRLTSSTGNGENRFINQLSYKKTLGFGDLGLRGRWEFREFADTPVFQNRLRANARLDLTQKVLQAKPFLSLEQLQVLNAVGSRPAGISESRYQAGLAFSLNILSKFETSYLKRTVFTPEYNGRPSSQSDYDILNVNLKIDL